VVSSIADRIAVMYAGRIVEQCPAGEILTAPQHPYTRMLIECSLLRQNEQGEFYAIPGQAGSARTISTGCRFRDRCTTAHAAHVEHKCAASEPDLAVSGHGTVGHTTRCWIPLQEKESA
jgi:peptide/nickel transport system ATP-binding protein